MRPRSTWRAVVRARLIAIGAVVFAHRSWTPIPFIVFLVLCTWKKSPDIVTWVPGLVLLAAGEGVRLWGVAVIGKESRTRVSGTARLVIAGPYAYVRNPLYLGNLVLTLGATMISELLWMLPIVAVLYALQYGPIVLWEEQQLAERFGAHYAAYCRRVPRWVPRCRRVSGTPCTYQWRAALWSERSTFAALALFICGMLGKENLPRLSTYLQKLTR